VAKKQQVASPINNQQPTRIQGKAVLDPVLLNRNIDHFAQANGTPFTVSPLLDLIGEDGCTQAALDILDETIPDNIDKYSTTILKQI
jgi:hypothetical protein